MKKIIVTAIAVLAVFALTACDDGNNKGDGTSPHTHDYGTAWKSNATQHWKECSCGDKTELANHDWEWVETTPATPTADGLETEKCKTCGAESGNTETRFSGEYATGTAGLSFTANYSNTAYSVSRGTAEGAIVIPAYYRPDANSPYLPVTTISDGTDSFNSNAFGGTNGDSNTTVTSIAFTEGSQLKTISNYAFSDCHSLTSMTIPDSVTSIGDWAFHNCPSLTGITIPAGVISIGDCAFYGCISLASVTIPDSVTSIGERAFGSCYGLTSITIPDSVTSIGEGVFRSCTGLTGITVAASNPNYSSEGGILYNKAKTELIQAPPGGISGSVTIPDSVTTVGRSAFSFCFGLTSVTIGVGVTTIGNEAFYACTGLTSITVAASNPNYSSEGGIVYNKAKTAIVAVPVGISGSVTLPNSVTSIGYMAFYDCTSLTSVTIPSSVTSIGQYAFFNCTGLTSITITDSVTAIGNMAFYNCTGLTSITIPNSVTTIDQVAFYEWSSSQTIYVPWAEGNRPSGWSSDWDQNCNAQIVYQG